jgi:hypothetical protein
MARASKPNPQIVKDEIVEYIRREGLAIYHVEPEMWQNERSVWWDTNRSPDYKKFIVAAKSNGAKMILYFDQELDEDAISDAEDALELAVLEPEEYREYARRIGDLRSYIGFTSRLGVGFASEGMFYWFDLEAPWYEDMLDMLEDLHLSAFPHQVPGLEEDEEEDEDPPLGNFYSKN